MDSQEGFEELFEFANEGILYANKKGEIVRANPSIERMFGYDSGELIGKKIEVLVPQSLAPKHVQDRTKFHQHPSPRSMGIGMDLKGKRKDDSEFPLEISLSPFTSKEGNSFVIAFVIDITIRKRQDEVLKNTNHELHYFAEELKATNTELEKRVRDRTLILEEALQELGKSREDLKTALYQERELNELKTRFVSMASHEFRTPLATILSSLSLVSKYGELNDKEKQTKHIDRIKTAIVHLTDLLNDMLSLSKLEEGMVPVKMEEINLKELAGGLILEMQSISKPGQEIRYKHSGDTETVQDKKVLKHILFNLISNAIKFSPEGKPIDISVEADPQRLMITVKDSGIGISEHDQKHLFERFFRANNATHIQGTGLGLNIVAKYVELLDGKIKVESKLDAGTIFIVELPIVKMGSEQNNHPPKHSAHR